MAKEQTTQSAYDALPHLVHYAQMGKLLTYGEIAAKVGRHHRAAQWFLWYIRDEICIPSGLPLLTAIVVRKDDGLPGPGWSPQDVSRLSDAAYRARWEAECARVFAHDGWEALLKDLGLLPPRGQARLSLCRDGCLTSGSCGKEGEMDPVEEAKRLLRVAYRDKDPEHRKQAIQLAIAQALIGIAEELRATQSPDTAADVAGPAPTLEEGVIVDGNLIRREDVLEAMRAFNEKYPDTNDYRNWLTTKNFEYALCYEGRLYPPSQLYRLVTGTRRSASVDRKRYEPLFQQLGFPVVKKPSGDEQQNT
jgi:hypothetical protein